jgi:hypothetical protein
MPALERLVPVDRRVAAPGLELAAGVPDLDPDEPVAVLPLLRPQAAPVRVGEVGDAAVRGDPADDVRQRRELALGDGRVGLDPERQDIHDLFGPAGSRVQLGGGDDQEPAGRPLDRPHPVVGDRQDVVAGPFVMAHELVRWQISIGVRCMRVQRAAEPDAAALERGHPFEPTARW